MIYEHWDVVDLDPVTWRNLGPYFDPRNFTTRGDPSERTLSILHDGGCVLKVWDSEEGARDDLHLDVIPDPLATAKELYESNRSWDRVQIFDKKSVLSFAHQAQELVHPEWDLDEYIAWVWELADADPEGLCDYPPRPRDWNGWRYSEVKHFVEEVIPDPSTLVLGVIEDGTLWAGLVLGVRDRQIKRVTTFEALLPLGLGPVTRLEDMDEVLALVARKFDPPAAALFCTRQVFEEWMRGEDKAGTLQRAIARGEAVLNPGAEYLG